MNQRVLVSGGLRVGDPARALIGAALAEITGQSIEVFEERLSGPTPWLLDLPTEAEARRLGDWAMAAAGVRTMLVPAVGAPAPSRAAGLAFLESRLGADSGRERAQVEAEDAEQVRRQAEAQKKARALAEDRAPAPREARQSGPIRPQAGGERLELDDAARPRSRRESAPLPQNVERPHHDLELQPERPPITRVALGVGSVLLLGFLVAPSIFGPVHRGAVQDELGTALRALADNPLVDERSTRQAVAGALRAERLDPETFEIEVFVAEDRLAVGLEADRGFALRTPEPGIRLRARARGEGRFLARTYPIDAYVDVLLPAAQLKGKAEPFWGDFVRLDTP
jgi:hypothetical protein